MHEDFEVLKVPVEQETETHGVKRLAVEFGGLEPWRPQPRSRLGNCGNTGCDTGFR